MFFKITSNINVPASGDVFFTSPTKEEIEKAIQIVVDLCNEKIENIYKEQPIESKKLISNRLNYEIDKIRSTETPYHFLILKEIAELSREEGYPVVALGDLSGSIVSYLLGIKKGLTLSPNLCRALLFAYRKGATMEVNKIKELTYAWRSTTDKVIEFKNPDIKDVQRLFKETYSLIDKYSKEEFVPKQISGLLLEMHDFSWWVSDLKDTPIHYLYQEIVSLVHKLYRYFLTRDANAEEIDKIINMLSKYISQPCSNLMEPHKPLIISS